MTKGFALGGGWLRRCGIPSTSDVACGPRSAPVSDGAPRSMRILIRDQRVLLLQVAMRGHLVEA